MFAGCEPNKTRTTNAACKTLIALGYHLTNVRADKEPLLHSHAPPWSPKPTRGGWQSLTGLPKSRQVVLHFLKSNEIEKQSIVLMGKAWQLH